MITITRHAEQRMKERCGLNKKSINRMAQRAYDEGVHAEETNGRLRTWAMYIASHDAQLKEVRLYGDKCYIYANNSLITVLQIPHLLRDHPSYRQNVRTRKQ